MDMRHTHEVLRLTEAMAEELKNAGHKIMPLSDSEAEEVSELTPEQRGEWMRKNRNRNKACPCGSGKKFKRCCW